MDDPLHSIRTAVTYSVKCCPTYKYNHGIHVTCNTTKLNVVQDTVIRHKFNLANVPVNYDVGVQNKSPGPQWSQC